MADYRAILKKYWGYDNFRGIQLQIIESIGSGHDTLGLMPTGGGKSIAFQVPAMAAEGLCLVVTPLIALMKDQVANLRARGIKAGAIYAGMRRSEATVTLENCIFGGYKFLYVSPERLQSPFFLQKVRHLPVSMITVDEAHCISQWGYDFRPSYLQIARVRTIFPHAPLLALTATATPQVADDIQEKLGFAQKRLFKMSFERPNLCYLLRRTDNKSGELLRILRRVPGSAILYTRNRKQTKELATLLAAAGFTAEFYHAGLTDREKDLREKQWKSGASRIMVATNAFGMGIDKPDVRIVLHWEMPNSIESYFQEAGRAGRDGERAYAVLLYSPGDNRTVKKRVADTFPDEEFIRRVYDSLAYYYQMAVGDGEGCTYTFSLADFCKTYRLPTLPTDSALRLLSRMGYIDYIEEMEYSARLMFILTREELYRLNRQEPRAERLIQAVLRRYSGIFSDFVPIDEALLARDTGLDASQIYLLFTHLQHCGILHYVPRIKTPYITYTRKRVEGERLCFAREVYAQRKENFVQRIGAMLAYATQQGLCRSRYLLGYFGEKNEHDCGQCDICRQRAEQGISRDELDRAASALLALLADGAAHPTTQLSSLNLKSELLDAALHHLLAEQKISLTGGGLLLSGDAAEQGGLEPNE